MERTLSRSTTFHQVLVDFAAKVQELSKQAVDDRTYVLVGELRQWMHKPSLTKLDDKYVSNTELLANAAYYHKSHFLPIDSSRILNPGRDCCVIVFSILLDLGFGHLIQTFLTKDIVDGRLPEDLSSLKRKLKSLQDGEQVAELFNQRQWKFCPAIFSRNMESEFFENRIIPICRKKQLGSGGTADVWQIVVQSEFVDKDLRNTLDCDEFASYDDKDFGPCYIFALKTFKEGFFEYYYDEKAAFDGLRSNRGVIRRLGCYSHRVLSYSAASNGHTGGQSQSVEAKDTMNLLLEYGTYDLRLIFGHQLPPVFPKEILAFWEALFEVADAVYGIHEFKTGGREFNGWHADIKPENIICVRGKYKLADPGFARFKKKAQDEGALPRIRLHGGTNTYGAPEVSGQANVHQTIDIWSLGCVFSMAATWVVLGYQGVCQYQQVREQALGTLLHAIQEDTHPLLVSQGFKANAKPQKLDCFHNGSEVLNEITCWHNWLKDSTRKTDPITEAVLDLIGQKMLIRDPKERISSKNLCGELQRIVRSSTKTLRDAMKAEPQEAREKREHLESLLYEIEKEASIQAAETPPSEPTPPFTVGLPVDRDALKVQLEHVTLKKTSHRFETIPGPRSRPNVPDAMFEKPDIVTSDTGGLKELLHHSTTRAESSTADQRERYRHSTFEEPPRTNTAFTNMTHRKTSRGPAAHAYLNAVQARELMDREMKRVLVKKKPRKDEVLSKYFRNRDIKFLVDDAVTMLEHWDEATYLLETLVMKAHGQDDDGLDLMFTNDRREVKNKKDATLFRNAMAIVRPKGEHQVHTNIKTALTPIFNQYLGTVQNASDKNQVNALTIIVLTDGLWEGMRNKNEVDEKIVEFYTLLTKEMKNLMKDRQVSIEFIQFGDDEEAQERLRRLDDDMPYRGVDDMIDYEKFSITGNVFKMLLGSFVEEMDAINDNEEHLSTAEDMDANAFQTPVATPRNTMPLQSISEESNNYSRTQQTLPPLQILPPPQPQPTPRKRDRFSVLRSRKS